mgnify:CR=1 FL=1
MHDTTFDLEGPDRPTHVREPGDDAPATDGERTIRVASVPAGHPYVLHLADPDGGDGVVRLSDPGDPWWPPVMLRPEWVDRHADEFDVMHIHFGFDGFEPADLAKLCGRLASNSKALVVTVHDLRNPHHETPELHRRQLRVLLDHADRVVTLTGWAADRIRDDFGVVAEVIPHPHIVALDDLRARRSRSRPTTHVVGVHLKSLRTNMEVGVVDAAVAAVARVPGATLRVDVHCDVASPTGERHDRDLMFRLHDACAAGSLDLHVHDFFDDDGFVDYIAGLRVSVLPYRFGTHSGWLEACRDLGVAVVAPDCGAYADQGADRTFRCNENDGFDAASCERAIEEALRAARPEPLPWQMRLEQRRLIAARHRELYGELIPRP